MNTITFSQAVEGFLLAINARHLSQHTIDDYFNTYKKFLIFLGYDPPIGDISIDQVRAFLADQSVSKKPS